MKRLIGMEEKKKCCHGERRQEEKTSDKKKVFRRENLSDSPIPKKTRRAFSTPVFGEAKQAIPFLKKKGWFLKLEKETKKTPIN